MARWSGFGHVWLVVVLTLGVAVVCHGEDPGRAGTVDEPQTASSPASPEMQPATVAGVHEQPDLGGTHDPAQGSIDCPLHGHGIDPASLRPFDDVERYIAFLEREDRAAWQKPDEVIAALQLAGDEIVADIGAGSGYFAFRFARALPRGRVIAADIEPEMIRHMHHRVMTEGIHNLEAALIQPDQPSVPEDVDLVFICDVLHHVTDRHAWLATIANAMPSGARLALIEFREGDLPKGPPASVKIPRARLIELVSNAGLTLTAQHPDLLPYQVLLVFTKP